MGNQTRENKIKGINVRYLNIILVSIEAILLSCALYCAVVTADKYNEVEAITNDYNNAQRDIYDIKQASDYLTGRARLYTMTGESKYAEEYYTELKVTMRREHAVESVNTARESLGIEGEDYLTLALEESDALADREIHAMALVYRVTRNLALAGGDTEEDVSRLASNELTRELTEYVLTSEEFTLSDSELVSLAYDDLFSESYGEDKDVIDNYISLASDQLLEEINTYKSSCSRAYHAASITMKALLCACALVFIIIVAALFALILVPITRGIQAIEEERSVGIGPAYELNYLGYVYNKLQEKNISTRNRLRETAQRDTLTGFLNRAGYEEVKKYFMNNLEPIVFMLIDVDHFKEVNDNYGHEEGDRALVKISQVLRDSFRSHDFFIRYGGDEFIVILTGIKEFPRDLVEDKLKMINRILQNDHKEGAPELSVSIGVSFSDEGFTPGLFEQADSALYETKKRGRCGYTLA